MALLVFFAGAAGALVVAADFGDGVGGGDGGLFFVGVGGGDADDAGGISCGRFGGKRGLDLVFVGLDILRNGGWLWDDFGEVNFK